MVSNLTAHQSANNNVRGSDKKRTITTLYKIVKALEAFKGNYHKKLNYERLSDVLKLSIHDAEEFLTLVFKFQDLFKDTFAHYILQKKHIQGITYLTASKDDTNPIIPEQIHMARSDAKLLSDVTYTFKHVNRGKGFNLKIANTELLKNIKTLKRGFPYLFKENGNNLTYPTEMGLSLGEMILSYSKIHKKLTDIRLNHSLITFEEDEDV